MVMAKMLKNNLWKTMDKVKGSSLNNNAPASIISRLLAGTVDLAIIFLVTFIASLYYSKFSFENIFSIYYCSSFVSGNTTVGGEIFKIYVLGKNNNPIGFLKIFGRVFFYFVVMMVNVVLFVANITDQNSLISDVTTIGTTIIILNLPMFITKEKRSLIDLLTSTKVVTKSLSA
jgi:uncharacterized RDD family membrane protein YckC